MMEDQNAEQLEELSYVRTFSALGEYQEAHEIIYQLEKVASGGYRMRLSQQGAIVREEEMILQVSAQQAIQLLTLLYENAVAIEIWQDVLMEQVCK